MILYVDNSANKMELIYLDLFVKLNVMKPLLYLLCNILISLVLCILEFPFSQLHTDIRVDCTLPRIFKYEKKPGLFQSEKIINYKEMELHIYVVISVRAYIRSFANPCYDINLA